jgi:hypothetical protein
MSADTAATLRSAAQERILVLDGAMGTLIQTLRLTEADFRGERFADWSHDLRGNNDLLILTKPDAIRGFHLDYLRAGADLVETNTFGSTSIAQADYGLEDFAYELNRDGARLAREAADIVTKETPDRPRFVAGAIGPTNRSASISPDVNNPGYRNVTFDDLIAAYGEAARGLIDGGADTEYAGQRKYARLSARIDSKPTNIAPAVNPYAISSSRSWSEKFIRHPRCGTRVRTPGRGASRPRSRARCVAPLRGRRCQHTGAPR